MEQQTAVEWLYNELSKNNTSTDSVIERINKESSIWEQAKQIEKEQREKEFIGGYKKRAELSNLMFDKASELFARSLFNEINKTK